MDRGTVEDLIRRLLDGKKHKATGKKVQLTETEIRHLCVTAKEIFLSQPNLLELVAPINVCGEHALTARRPVSCRWMPMPVPIADMIRCACVDLRACR